MIQLNDIACCFGRHPVFSGVNLTIPAGRIVGLLGKNGEGKTTLLKLMAGALFPSSGVIRITDMTPGDRLPDWLSTVFFVPEQPDVPALTPLTYSRHLSAFYPTFDRDLFTRFVSLFEVNASARLRQLSFGQQKKVFLAGALASGCRLILLDEPTNGLDMPGKALFRRFMAEVATETSTWILSTHQTRDLASILDTVTILHQSGVVLNQTLEAIGERLSTTFQKEDPGPAALYSQRVLGGYAVIDQHGTPDGETPDLELLFSAVINDPDRIRAIFSLEQGRGDDE